MAEVEWEENRAGYRTGKVPIESAQDSVSPRFIGINENHGGPETQSGICFYLDHPREEQFADRRIAWMSEDEAMDLVDAIMDLLAHRRDRRMKRGER